MVESLNRLFDSRIFMKINAGFGFLLFGFFLYFYFSKEGRMNVAVGLLLRLH